MTKIISVLALSLLSVGILDVRAQTLATTPVKHTCGKPEYPGRLASDMRMKMFNREMEGFKTCISKFVDEQKKMADHLLAQQRLHVDAGNGAINEYNELIKELNKAAGTDEDKK